MIKPLQSAVIALASAALLFTACNKEGGATGGTAAPTTTAPAAAGGENPGQAIASYSGGTITLKQVDEKISGQLKQMDKKKLELRQQTAEQMVLEALVKAEAAKAGQTDEQWLKANIESKIPPPSDAEILKVFEENKARMPPGSTVESMREQIIGFLQQDQRREAAGKLFDEIKTKANYKLLLEEPRVQVAAVGPARGPDSAPITIVEFSDFECPFCSRVVPSIDEVVKTYGDQVRVAFRQFPLNIHPRAQKAAEASLCAHEQGKFWQMHDLMFGDQKKLEIADLKSKAGSLGVDQAKFDACLDGGKYASQVSADMADGQKAGVTGTPAIFINGRFVNGAVPYGDLAKIIDDELMRKGITPKKAAAN